MPHSAAARLTSQKRHHRHETDRQEVGKAVQPQFPFAICRAPGRRVAPGVRRMPTERSETGKTAPMVAPITASAPPVTTPNNSPPVIDSRAACGRDTVTDAV